MILIKLLAREEYTRSIRRIPLVLKLTVRWRKMVGGTVSGDMLFAALIKW